MREFGKQFFSNYVYICIYNNKKTAELFDRDFDSKRIINAIEIQYHERIVKEKALLIFDKIQEAPKVLESLKYF